SYRAAGAAGARRRDERGALELRSVQLSSAHPRSAMKASLRSLLVLFPALLLVACETTKPPLPGERLSVLRLDKQLEPDPEIAALEVRLPRPVVNADWPEAGGYPNHVMQHVALGDDIATSWRTS